MGTPWLHEGLGVTQSAAAQALCREQPAPSLPPSSQLQGAQGSRLSRLGHLTRVQVPGASMPLSWSHDPVMAGSDWTRKVLCGLASAPSLGVTRSIGQQGLVANPKAKPAPTHLSSPPTLHPVLPPCSPWPRVSLTSHRGASTLLLSTTSRPGASTGLQGAGWRSSGTEPTAWKLVYLRAP